MTATNFLRPVNEAVAAFEPGASVPVRAVLLGDRLHLRGLYEPPLALAPLVLAAGEHGLAMLFRYGAAVSFNLTPEEHRQLIAHLRERVQGTVNRPETEDTTVFVSPPNTDSVITTEGIGLYDFSLSRLKIVAIVLARSVALARYETAMAAAFDLVEPLALQVEQEARGRRMRELLRHIGGVLLIQHKMVGRVEIQEKPELIWDQPELERLYLRLEAEYELRERNAVLERKLAIISRTAETTINLLHNRRMLRVEWYIVVLIVAEVILYSYEIWWH